jgi:hypothetical protein
MGQPTTIVCLKQGIKYSAEYVNNLFAAVEMNVTVPYHLLCITDDPTGVDYPTKPIEGPYLGWWAKLSLFQRAPYGLSGNILYLDLDTIVLKNIDSLVEYESDFCILRDFTRPDRYGSAVFKLTLTKYCQVWEGFNAEHQERVGIYGDQEWIWEKVPNADLWPKSWCVSYKEHCQNGVPPQAKLLCFHGEPKPHNVGGWAQRLWSRYQGTQNNRVQAKLDGKNGVSSGSGTVEGFQTFIFSGQLRYRCTDCGFDTYSIDLVKQHYATSHQDAQAPMPTLFDSEGKQVQRDIHVPAALQNFRSSLTRS